MHSSSAQRCRPPRRRRFTESFGVAVNVENMPGAALAAFAKLPADGYTLLRGYTESLKLLNDPEVRGRFTQLGLDVSDVPGPELLGIIKADLAKWAKVIKQAGITAAD